MAGAADNTGSGGVITYTDANGLNPVSSAPYANGYTVPVNATATVFVPAKDEW